MKRAEINEQLRYKFTPEEHTANTRALVEKMGQQDEMEETAKAVKAGLKEQAERVSADIGRYMRLVRDGFEPREVRCRWDYGRPSNTQKTLVRLDSGEDVRVEIMFDHERQEMLKFDEPSHVLSGPGSLKDKKVGDLDDSDVEYFASRDVDELLKFKWLQADIDAVFAEAKKRAEARGGVIDTEVHVVEGAVNVGGAATTAATAAQAAAELASESAGCRLCHFGVPLRSDGLSHGDDADGGEGVPCPLVSRNAALLKPAEEPNTLPSVRSIDGPGRKKRSAPVKPPTAEEREDLERLQAENAPSIDDDQPF